MGGVHNSRFVPHQDPGEASDQGRHQEHFWQGGKGCSEAGQDSREGISSGCIEEADLERCSAVFLAVLIAFSEVQLPWESHGTGLRGALCVHGNLHVYINSRCVTVY